MSLPCSSDHWLEETMKVNTSWPPLGPLCCGTHLLIGLRNPAPTLRYPT